MAGTTDEEMNRAKLVDRLASEYTQLKYLVGKAKSEGCKIVESVTPVSGYPLPDQRATVV